MKSNLEERWNNTIQKDFVSSLDHEQAEALLDLLIVGTFADENVTLEERRGLSLAISQLPGLDEAVELDTDEVADRTELLFTEFDANRGALLRDLAARLGDESARRHAFRTTVQLLAADGFAMSEEAFVRELGEQMGIEETIVDFAVRDAAEGD